MQIEAIQIIYNRLERWPEETARSTSVASNDLGVLARVPLASGFLERQVQAGPPVSTAGEVRGRQKQEDRDAKLREVEQIASVEVPPGVAMARWALAWCLEHHAVSCVIPGCKDAAQVRDNAAAVGLLKTF